MFTNGKNDMRTMLKEADRLSSTPGGAKHAAEIYLGLLEDEPENVELLMKASFILYYAVDDYEQETVSRILSMAEKAVELAPDNADAHHNLAVLLDLFGFDNRELLPRAAHEYMTALTLNPASWQSAISVVQARKILNISLEDAIGYLENTIRLGKPDPLAFEYLGHLYAEAEDYARAQSAYERALQMPEVSAMRGRKRLERAIKEMKRLKRQKNT